MSETAAQSVVFEKPKAVWVVGAWLSTLAAVLGAGMLGGTILYGAVFTGLVGVWTVYGAGSPLSVRSKVLLGVLGVWTIGLQWWLATVERLAERGPRVGFHGLTATQASNLLSAALLFAACLVSGVLAGLIPRSRQTLVICAAASVPLWVRLLDIAALSAASAVGWHAIVFGAIVLWAVRTRTRRLSGSHCAGCGYDLAGIEGPVCPECGRARVMAGPSAAA